VKTRHPDMQKLRIIGFFLENRLNWQFEVRLLLFTVCRKREREKRSYSTTERDMEGKCACR